MRLSRFLAEKEALYASKNSSLFSLSFCLMEKSELLGYQRQ